MEWVSIMKPQDQLLWIIVMFLWLRWNHLRMEVWAVLTARTPHRSLTSQGIQSFLNSPSRSITLSIIYCWIMKCQNIKCRSAESEEWEKRPMRNSLWLTTSDNYFTQCRPFRSLIILRSMRPTSLIRHLCKARVDKALLLLVSKWIICHKAAAVEAGIIRTRVAAVAMQRAWVRVSSKGQSSLAKGAPHPAPAHKCSLWASKCSQGCINLGKIKSP